MSSPVSSPLTALINRLLPRMRYPHLFLVLGLLFLIDLVFPDPIPLVDEIVLAVLTFLAATFTKRRDTDPEPRDITPAEEERPFLSSGENPRTPGDG